MAEIIAINDTTYRIEDDFVRYFLLLGDEQAVLIDSGATSPDARRVAESLTDLPLILVNTHADKDHTAGNGAFESFYMHPADFENCCGSQGNCHPLSDGACIDPGHRPLRIVHIPGHTFGSVAILDEKNRVLYPGDTVQTGNIFLFGPHRCPEQFADSLKKIMALEGFDTLYPSHGAPEVSRDYTEKVLAAWEAVQAGRVESTPVEMFGHPVRLFTTPDCGFFLE